MRKIIENFKAHPFLQINNKQKTGVFLQNPVFQEISPQQFNKNKKGSQN